MSIKEDIDRLSNIQTPKFLTHNLPLTEPIDVYYSNVDKNHRHAIYCALIPTEKIEKSLSNSSWDLTIGHGLPSATVSYDGDKDHAEYFRYGDTDGIEPLVIYREFYGMRENYFEINEEFRLFHGLYHDKKLNQYIKIDDDGNEDSIIEMKPNRIQIRLKDIRQFLAIKEMHLSIQFDFVEFSNHTIEELGFTEGGGFYRDNLVCWDHHFGDYKGFNSYKTVSRLLGLRLIEPLPKSKSGFWGFAEDTQKKYVDFIIDVDEYGEEITFNSNPDELANYFGANPDSPHYLTPVHFRKEVLDKYYFKSSKYSVDDSYLSCGSLWGMSLDNHHDDKVCAWLGDLGRDLPYTEQLHWKSYNIPPEGGISETYFRRQILSQFTDSDRPELLFKRRYQDLEKACKEHLGWQLLLPLSARDNHYFECIRIPATDEQSDFDELILAITKVLIDSINEKLLNQYIPADQVEDIQGSVARLEAVFNAIGIQDADDYILYLRKLQNLRSSGTAHRKGSRYKKIAQDFGIDEYNLPDVFSVILSQALGFLEFLTALVISGRLKI